MNKGFSLFHTRHIIFDEVHVITQKSDFLSWVMGFTKYYLLDESNDHYFICELQRMISLSYWCFCLCVSLFLCDTKSAYSPNWQVETRVMMFCLLGKVLSLPGVTKHCNCLLFRVVARNLSIPFYYCQILWWTHSQD